MELNNKLTESITEFQTKNQSVRSMLKSKESQINDLEQKFETKLIDCHKRCLEKLAEKSGSWINKANQSGQTPLLQAICRRSDEWII